MYASVTDMTARFGELEMIQISDRSHEGVIDSAVVVTALYDACAEIDGYLGRYTTPIEPPPRELVRVACDIAHYRLCGVNNTLLTEEIIKRYDRNIAWLVRVSKGEVNLAGVVVAGAGVDDASDAVQFVASNKVFSR